MKGPPNVATRTFTKVNDRTWQVVDKLHSGKPGLTRREVVSADGRTLTVTVTGTTAQAETLNSVVVFEKQ